MRGAFRAEIKAATADAGTWTAVANAPVTDRDGEIIDPGALYWRTETVPVHLGHPTLSRQEPTDRIVGRARPWYQGDTLMVDGRFSSLPLAQQARQMVKDGVLDSMSVAFIGTDRQADRDGVVHIRSAELIAVDWVTVPSNREAQVVSVRGLRAGRGRGTGWAQHMAAKALIDQLEAELYVADAAARGRYDLPAARRDLAELHSFMAWLDQQGEG